MLIAQIFEWPHPQIDKDWERGKLRWREITPSAYRELRAVAPLRHEAGDGFMQSEPVDVLADGDYLYVCCKAAGGRYFARLLPGSDWWKRDYLPVPETGALP